MMTPERWQQVKERLGPASEMGPELRPAYLEQACFGDPSLREEVERLLAAQASAGGFLSDFAARQEPDRLFSVEADRRIGQRIGAYKIVERIGEGGMGAVYSAVRADDQYQKQVAIKLVHANQDSAFIISRFKHERQILASLDHPHIARLLDGGNNEEGEPFFVMELIEGEPIDRCCNQRKLPVAERLKLFLEVCSAVQYAHQRLIIHRDIKPGNILVTSAGLPKLLDFGIAKILDTSATGPLEATLTMFRVLTPAYASPEQMQGEPITTATDVYSLGVVLYELLTGSHPYRKADSTPQEIARAVCESVPVKPSTAVSQTESANGAPDSQNSSRVSQAFDGSAEKLRKRLQGDLDNIVLMALRKEPQRRYPSVEQFAEDIMRHLRSLPVVAREDTFGYRASKFIARHRSGVAAVVGMVLTLLAGLTVTLHEAHVAHRERVLSEQRFNEVRQLANSMLFDIHDSIRDLPGSTAARKLLVDRARQYLDSLLRQAASVPDLQRELAAAYERVGDVQGNPRYANLGDTAGAIESYRKALRLRLAMGEVGGGSADDRIALAAISVKLSFALGATSDFAAALATLQRAYPVAEQLAAEQKDNPQIQEAVAQVYFATAQCLSDMGSLTSALEYYRKTAAIREAITGGSPAFQTQVRTDLAGVYDYMSEVVYLLGDLDAALLLQTQARDTMARLLESDPQNATLRQFLLQAEYGIGYYLAEKKLPEQALPHYEIALAGYRKLTSSDVHDVVGMRYLGKCYMSIGTVLAAEGRADRGIHFAREAVRIFEALSAADQADTYYKAPDLAYSRSALGEAYSRLAVRPGVPKETRIASWRQARLWYQNSLQTWLLLKRQAPLARWDAAQPDKITNEIARCDAAITRLHTDHQGRQIGQRDDEMDSRATEGKPPSPPA